MEAELAWDALEWLSVRNYIYIDSQFYNNRYPINSTFRIMAPPCNQ